MICSEGSAIRHRVPADGHRSARRRSFKNPLFDEEKQGERGLDALLDLSDGGATGL